MCNRSGARLSAGEPQASRRQGPCGSRLSFRRVLDAPVRNFSYPRDRNGKCQGQGLEKSGKERKGEGGAFGNDIRSYVGQETFQIPHGEMDWS